VTITNAGDQPLNLIAVQIDGDFHAVNGCGTTLIGHADCVVTVTYVPTRVGPEAGTLTVADMYGRPNSVALTGIGTAPGGVSALPSAVDFGDYAVGKTSAAQSVTITNSGGLPLDSLQFALSGAFAITGNSCPSPLAAGTSCSAQVVFSPNQSGPLSGMLNITSPSLSAPFQVVLSGSGLGFAFQADGSSSATVTSGKTANYLLQIIPAAGSSGTLALACASLPQYSSCVISPSSVQLASGVTSSIGVAITTSSGAISSGVIPDHSEKQPAFILCAMFFPAGIFGLFRLRGRVGLLAVFILGLFCLGCGVTASGGGSGSSTDNGPGSTPSATYTPVITAVGPGITKSVHLTLIVD
jgi:hypothetical protein